MMFRRRPFRPRRPLIPRHYLRHFGDDPQQALRKAHHLMENGNFQEAAKLFERLAKGAQDRGILKHAPFLYFKAARCRLETSQTRRAVGLLSLGLKLLADTQRWQALHWAGDRAVAELRHHGQSQTAEEVQEWLDKTLKDHPESAQEAPTPQTRGGEIPKLPAKCPFCGATIRADQVEWINEVSAECIYCGSSVTTEE